MIKLDEAKAVCLAWLDNMWGERRRAARIAAEYRNIAKQSPNALADFAKFCCAHDTCYVQGDRDLLLINSGKREAFLHLQTMAGLTPVDLKLLKDRTEGDPE